MGLDYESAKKAAVNAPKVSNIIGLSITGVDDEYSADGSLAGASTDFTVNFQGGYPAPLVITLLRRLSSETDADYKQVKMNTFQPLYGTDIIKGTLVDDTVTVGVEYLYKLSIVSPSEGVKLKNKIVGHTSYQALVGSIVMDSGTTFTPGYYDSFHYYPTIINITKSTSKELTLDLSWNFPGHGYNPALFPAPNNAGNIGDYKKLLTNGFRDEAADYDRSVSTRLAMSFAIAGLIPRDPVKANTIVGSGGDYPIMTVAALNAHPDIAEWTFEIQKSHSSEAQTDANADDIIDDTTPDDESSDHNPIDDDADFELIYRGQSDKQTVVFENAENLLDIYFAGSLLIKWSNRVIQLAKVAASKRTEGDAPAPGLETGRTTRETGTPHMEVK